MSQQLYSVDQVAQLLGLHVRTVRNYVREGRLKAVRIGKQYRIAHDDLEALTGGPVEAPGDVGLQRHVEVSSVVQVDAISPEDAGRVSTYLLSAISGRHEEEPLHVQTAYDETRGRLKVILLGGLADTAALLQIIDSLTGRDHD
jgi:excisionase family DNA binding protein